MSRAPRLVAFDLDDTLAPSKSPLDPRMAELLVRLLDTVEVCVISGGQFGQFRMQVVDRLTEATPTQLARLHLMPTCGTQYFRHSGAAWDQLYAQNLTEDEKARARKWGIEDLDRIYRLEDLAKGDCIFAATGVTDGSLLEGVKYRKGGRMTTESVVMRASSGTIRWVKGDHRDG